MRGLILSLLLFADFIVVSRGNLLRRRTVRASNGAGARVQLRRAKVRDLQLPVGSDNPDEPSITQQVVPDADKLPKSSEELPLGSLVPELGVQSDKELPKPPESKPVKPFEIAQPTPMPSAYNGVYCRGGACQYRVPAPLPTTLPVTPPVPLGPGLTLLSGREFCRGLGCLPQMGWPGDPNIAGNNLNCLHLFNDIGGGLSGKDDSRTVKDVYDSFIKACQWKVNPLEAPACPSYADVWVAAVSPSLENPSVGDVTQVCTSEHFFVAAFKQAEIDLKFTAAALPKGDSLLGLASNRFGSGGLGPDSPRGRRWREWAWQHHAAGAREAGDGSSEAGSSTEGLQPLVSPRSETSFAQWGDAVWVDNAAPGKGVQEQPPKPLLPGADSDKDTPRGVPRYRPNPPCDTSHVNPQSATKYQLLPGSADGVVPPVEVSGDLYTYCADQMSEIMLGFAQTPSMIVQMTKDWCGWQASVTSWTGLKEEYGHPDWDHRRCAGMVQFMAFALRNELKMDSKDGMSPQQVCKNVFLSINTVHRVDKMIKDAWTVTLRSSPTSAGAIPSADDEAMKELMQKTQEFADGLYSKLRGRKKAFEDLTAAKMDTAAFSTDSIQAQSPGSFIDMGETGWRSSDFAVTSAPLLQQWGSWLGA
mmetsp:Transcript_48356/g.87430  ORF Transcript_48356/g.87430 Transcript_48356/m.87430 type:complete len:644 (+) Transcript_48356:98-2029(+)